MREQIRILLADPSKEFREMFARAVEQEKGVTLAGQTDDGEELLRLKRDRLDKRRLELGHLPAKGPHNSALRRPTAPFGKILGRDKGGIFPGTADRLRMAERY